MASKEEILAGLAEIVNEETGLETEAVQLDKNFTEDLDIDSISMMTIVVNCEEKFEVTIPDEEVKNLKTVQDAVDFIDGAQLVAHNAGFDIAFINAELERLGQPAVDPGRVVDTLAIARRKHPMGPNSLDALCRRYGIDNSHRSKHGALLDSELLAEVYVELAGGKQAALGLEYAPATGATTLTPTTSAIVTKAPTAQSQ